ncbi:MAG TPA: penicillin-binding transpeptidase domain-containing protein, partial [Acidimicrobiales bacterium]
MSTTRRNSPPRRSSAGTKGTKGTTGTTSRGRDGSPRRASSSPPGAASSTRARGAKSGTRAAKPAAKPAARPANRSSATRSSARTSSSTRSTTGTTTRARTGSRSSGTGPGRAGATGTAPRSRRAEPPRRAPAAPPAGPTRPRRRRYRIGPGEPDRRAVTFLAVMVVLFSLVGLRLVMVQVVRADHWANYGEDQRIRPIELVAGRGAIFDRNGYDLAISVQQATYVADPRLIDDPAATAATLAPVLGLDPAKQAELAERLGRDASFVYVARQVPDDVAEQIDELIEEGEVTGLWSIDEAKRINPAGELARSILGRVNVDNEGVSALELQYDENLTGEPGELIVEKDLQGRTIPAGRHHLDPAEPGEDLELTIDRNLQVAAEQVMIDAVREKEARGGTAIVTNPETGEILALVNIERDAAGQPVSSGNNVAVTANYEPGSVNKVITLAAAIEEGLVEPDTELMVPAQLQVADHTFEDSHGHGTEAMTVTDILTDSSN